MASRQTYYAESLGEDTTTSASYQDKVTCTFTPEASTDYYIFWSCLCNENSTSEDVFVRLYNSTDAVVLAEQNQELRASSNYRTSHGIAKYTSGGSPASTSFKIQYASEVAGTTSKIKEARILVIKADALDEYAEYLTADTTTSNSYVDTSCSLVFTPATTGDYLIFASCDAKSSSSTDPFFVKLVDSTGADVAPMWRINRDGANFNPYTTFIKQNLTSGASKTFKFQFKRTSAGTITLQNQRILALRLDQFTQAYYAEDRTRATTTSATYVDDVSLTQTTQPVEHIVFNTAFLDNNATTNAAGSTFNEDGSAIQDGFLWGGETGSGSLTTSMSLFVAYRITPTYASHTWKRQWKIAGGSTSGIDEDAIAVLQTARDNTGTVAATESEDTAAISATVSSGGITASVAVTEENDSASIAAAVKVTGSVATTESEDSSSISSQVAVASSVNASEENDSGAISAAVRVTGSVSTSEEEDASTIAAAAKITGSVNATETDDSCSGSAAVKITGSVNTSEDSDAAAIAAQVKITCYLGRAKLPTDISGLVAWYDAQDASSITKDGSNLVSQWNDKSGNGNHLTQSTTARKPKYVYSAINSLPALQSYHDSVNHSLLTKTDNATLNYTDLTVFVVMQRVGDAGGTETIFGKLNHYNGENEFRLFCSSGDTFQFGVTSGGTGATIAAAASTGLTVGTPYLLEAKYTPTTLSARPNVGSYATGTISSIYQGTAPLCAFSYANYAESYRGYIGEIIMFNQYLSAADIAAVSQYLDDKWNLSLNPAKSGLEDDDTSAITVQHVSTGSTAATEEDDILSASAQVQITFYSNTAEEEDQLSSAVSTSHISSVNVVSEDHTSSASVLVKVTGSDNSTEEDDTLSSITKVLITTSVSVSEEDDTLSSSVNVIGGATDSSVNTLEENDTSVSNVQVLVNTSLSTTEGEDSLSSSAQVVVATTVSTIEQDDSLFSGSQVKITADIATLEQDDTLSAVGKVEIICRVVVDQENGVLSSSVMVLSVTVTPASRTFIVPARGKSLSILSRTKVFQPAALTKSFLIDTKDKNYLVLARNRIYSIPEGL